jgi:hypothetical protein
VNPFDDCTTIVIEHIGLVPLGVEDAEQSARRSTAPLVHRRRAGHDHRTAEALRKARRRLSRPQRSGLTGKAASDRRGARARTGVASARRSYLTREFDGSWAGTGAPLVSAAGSSSRESTPSLRKTRHCVCLDNHLGRAARQVDRRRSGAHAAAGSGPCAGAGVLAQPWRGPSACRTCAFGRGRGRACPSP